MEFIVDPITLKYNDLVEIKHPKSKSRLEVTTNKRKEQIVAPDRWRITEATGNMDGTGISFKAYALIFDKNEQQYFNAEDVKELSFFVKRTISPYRSLGNNIELDKYLFIMHEKDLTENFYSEIYSQEEVDKILLTVKNCLKEWRIIPGLSEDVLLLKSELLKLLRNRNDNSLSEFISSPSGEIFIKLLPKNIQNKLTLNCFKTNQ